MSISEYVICVGQPMERDIMLQVPKPAAGWEVMRGYRRVSRQAVKLAAHIRGLGWEAKAHADPKTGSLLHIPPAIRAGLGELGKHGSIITREWGSNVRLAAVTTNLPLAVDDPVDIGVDDLCVACRRCTLDCPPGRDHGQQADGPGRGEVVRRFRQVRCPTSPRIRAAPSVSRCVRGRNRAGVRNCHETLLAQTAKGRLRR